MTVWTWRTCIGAYWHACAATPHIAPAHFGAAIEALQAAYIKANHDHVPSAWAPREEWKALRATLTATIESADISSEAKAALSENLSTFNGIDQRQKLKSLMAALNIRLGNDEDAAWRRRNTARAWNTYSRGKGAGGDPGHEPAEGLVSPALAAGHQRRGAVHRLRLAPPRIPQLGRRPARRSGARAGGLGIREFAVEGDVGERLGDAVVVQGEVKVGALLERLH